MQCSVDVGGLVTYRGIRGFAVMRYLNSRLTFTLRWYTPPEDGHYPSTATNWARRGVTSFVRGMMLTLLQSANHIVGN